MKMMSASSAGQDRIKNQTKFTVGSWSNQSGQIIFSNRNQDLNLNLNNYMRNLLQNENNNANHQFSNSEPMTFAQKVAFLESLSNNKQGILEKEFAPYAEALSLKELGFDKPCFGCFNHLDKSEIWTNRTYMNGLTENITAPTFSQVFRFFREKYNKLSVIDHATGGWYFVIREIGGSTDPMLKAVCGSGLKSYEEAELACLQKLIEIAKEKQNEITI